VGVANYVYGVVRVESDGSFTHVAGSDSTLGSKSDGVSALNAYFTGPPRIAFDNVGNLYVSIRGDYVVRRIDAATYRINTVAGAPATSPIVYGDYGPATSAQLSYPEDIVFDAQNNLHIIDSNNDSVRSVWKVGSAAASSYALTIAGGTGQTAVPVDSVFETLSVKLVDGANANVLNVPVRWSRTDLGSSLAAPSVPTNAIAGISANNGRVGLMPGPYRFDATYSDVHGNSTTRTFTVTAVAPAAGTIFTIVNTSMVSANTGVPGPGTVSQTSYTHDAVAASDGTLYLADYCSIEKLSPAGEISRFAGLPGSCAQAQGDGGPALDARFYAPKGMALDETNKLLYVSDTGYGRIRVIDLQTNIVQALAGGGTANAIPWGNGPSGATAVFSAASKIALGSGGKLYVSDSGHNRIRVVDVNTTAVSDFLVPTSTTCATDQVNITNIDTLTDIIWLANGDALISGRICGILPANGAGPTNTSLGIVRRSAAGALTHVAGTFSSSATSEGLDATKAYFPDLGGMARDSAGNIYIAIPSIHKVRKIDGVTGKITTIAGTGASTSTGPATDYIAGPLSTLENPQAVAIVKGGTANPGDHLIIADYNNYAFREVW
jgi:sugar lactone lactonase YvrE